MPKEILNTCRQKMDKALESLRVDLSKLRTGRASVALLDGVRVDAYGSLSPLNQVASLSVADSRLIVVTPWDKTLIGPIEKAIMKADLGLTPSSDGKLVRVPLPSLNEERRKELVKQARKVGEESKVGIRNSRREANEALKKIQKDKNIPEDDIKREEQNVQKMTDDFTKQVDEILTRKEKEIMEV